MESRADKEWATKYLLDPLNAPEPSQETGPGSHFKSTRSSSSAHRRPLSMGKAPSSTGSGLPTPPRSASPTRSSFHPSNPYSPDHRQSAFSIYSPTTRASRGSFDSTSSSPRNRRHSHSQLPARFGGDNSMRPLDQIKRESKEAYRSPHLRRSHIPNPDVIDILDQSVFGAAYHHEGPYDATLLVRNTDPKISPVAATKTINEEALKATQREYIVDSLTKHVPLQGTAIVPPGEQSVNGEFMNYSEGADLQREADASGGAYKRWEGMRYHADDFKGKGEPSFSIERQLKDHRQQNAHRRYASDGNAIYEMQTRPNQRHDTRPMSTHGNSLDLSRSRPAQSESQGTGTHSRDGSVSSVVSETAVQRRNSTGFGAGLKKRIGGLRRGHVHD